MSSSSSSSVRSIASATQIDHWSNSALDLLVAFHNKEVPSLEVYTKKVVDLAERIMAISNLTISTTDLEKIVKFDYIFLLQEENKIEGLIKSNIFYALTQASNRFIEAADKKFYEESIIPKLIKAMSVVKGPLNFILENKKCIKWFVKVNQCITTSQEMHDMRISMEKIPEEFYNNTQPLRMQIGQAIKTRSVCENVIKLLNGTADVGSVDAVSQSIFNRYQNELLINTVTEEVGAAVRLNLLTSLSIRVRHLSRE